jgi:hypothetical protein
MVRAVELFLGRIRAPRVDALSRRISLQKNSPCGATAQSSAGWKDGGDAYIGFRLIKRRSVWRSSRTSFSNVYRFSVRPPAAVDLRELPAVERGKRFRMRISPR